MWNHRRNLQTNPQRNGFDKKCQSWGKSAERWPHRRGSDARFDGGNAGVAGQEGKGKTSEPVIETLPDNRGKNVWAHSDRATPAPPAPPATPATLFLSPSPLLTRHSVAAFCLFPSDWFISDWIIGRLLLRIKAIKCGSAPSANIHPAGRKHSRYSGLQRAIALRYSTTAASLTKTTPRRRWRLTNSAGGRHPAAGISRAFRHQAKSQAKIAGKKKTQTRNDPFIFLIFTFSLSLLEMIIDIYLIDWLIECLHFQWDGGRMKHERHLLPIELLEMDETVLPSISFSFGCCWCWSAAE